MSTFGRKLSLSVVKVEGAKLLQIIIGGRLEWRCRCNVGMWCHVRDQLGLRADQPCRQKRKIDRLAFDLCHIAKSGKVIRAKSNDTLLGPGTLFGSGTAFSSLSSIYSAAALEQLSTLLDNSEQAVVENRLASIFIAFFALLLYSTPPKKILRIQK